MQLILSCLKLILLNFLKNGKYKCKHYYINKTKIKIIYLLLKIQCCEPNQDKASINEITTEKKRNTRIATESGNLEELNKFKLQNINLGKDNLSDIFDKIDKNNFDNISKINEVSQKSKNLNIELISSCFEPKGLILKITPFGYEKSLRKETDGITYFGYEEQQDNVSIIKYN